MTPSRRTIAPTTTADEEASPPAPRQKLVCRPLGDADVEAAARLLIATFPERPAAYWRRALERLGARAVPEGYPRFGYVMADGERLVGILLLIISLDDEGRPRGNVSSWAVEPAYRMFSGLLLSAPMRLKAVTLVNVSPAPRTIATIEAQGFRRYVSGTFHALALLSPRVAGARIRVVRPDTADAAPILRDHAAFGCLAFEVAHAGRVHPFVFVPFRSVNDRLPCAHLVYCRSVEDFTRFAGPLGRRLARGGFASVILDATGPVPGLVGRYQDGKRLKFFRGPAAPRLGDLSYFELAVFGP